MFARSALYKQIGRISRFLAVLLLLVFPLYFTQMVASGAELPPRHLPNASNTQTGGVMMQLNGRFSDDWPFTQLHWQQDLWLVVQWQTDNGSWQDVPGWQGHFDTIQPGDQWLGQKLFWADDPLLGSGPYRWLVIDTKNSQVVGTSEPYYLPANTGEITAIDLEISQ